MAIVKARLARALIFDERLQGATDRMLELMDAASRRMQSPDGTGGVDQSDARWAAAVEIVTRLNNGIGFYMREVDRVARPQGL